MPTVKPVILIVEDEFLLRMDSVEILEDGGFEVIPATNARRSHRNPVPRSDIHLVFTDIQMPGSMDGLKLARFVRDRWPPIKIVATQISQAQPSATHCDDPLWSPQVHRLLNRSLKPPRLQRSTEFN